MSSPMWEHEMRANMAYRTERLMEELPRQPRRRRWLLGRDRTVTVAAPAPAPAVVVAAEPAPAAASPLAIPLPETAPLGLAGGAAMA